MAALPPEALAAALGAVHKTGLNTDPNATDPASGGGSSAPAAPADPSQDPAAQQDPNADPNAQGGADPLHQALWQLFPSTDPSWLQGLLSQGGDPEQTIGQAFQQVESDRSQFDQLQDSMMAHLVTMFSTPDGGGQDMGGGAAPQDPGVGGAGAGY